LPSAFAFWIGWPAIVVAMVLVGVGLVRRRRAPLVFSALLMLPVCLYLSATPRFAVYPLLFPLLLGASAWATPRSIRLAGALAIPSVVFAIYLAIAVLTYARPE
jgi:hypothetical protein